MSELRKPLDQQAPYMHVASSIRILVRNAMMLKILAAVSYMILMAAGERPPISGFERTLIAPQPEARPKFAERGSLGEDGPELEAKEEKEVLEEENATKQLRSSVAELSEEAEDSEGVGTSLRLLMSSAAEFFDSAEMAEEVAGLEGLRLVKEVADHGASLRHRFQTFVLLTSLKIALGNDDPPDGKQTPKQLVPTKHINSGEDNMNRPGSTQSYKQDDVASGNSGEDADFDLPKDDFEEEEIVFEDAKEDKAKEENTCSIVGGMVSVENNAVQRLKPWIAQDNAIKEAEAKRSLLAFCKIAAIDKEGKGDKLPADDKDLKDLVQEKPEDRSEDVKEKSEKSRHLEALQKALKDSGIARGRFPTGSLAGVRRIYSRALAQVMRIRTVIDLLQKNLEIDWLAVEDKKKTPKGIKKVAKVVMKKLKAILVYFKSKLRKGERKCEEKNQKQDKKIAVAAELKGEKALLQHEESSKLANDLMKEADDKDPAKLTKVINRLSSNSEKALENVEKTADDDKRKAEDIKKTLSSSVKATEKAFQPSKYSEKQLEEVMHTLEDNGKIVEEEEENLCKKQHAKAASGFKEAFQKAKAEAEGTGWPNLGTRGGAFNLGQVSGGIEEILDFNNLEIAQFRYGDALKSETLKADDLVPTGTSAFGLGVGGYVGVGWKGYKRDWSLETAIGAGISISASVSIFGTPLSGSATVVVDADASPGKWKLVKGSTKTIALGVGVGLSLLPLPVGVDFGVPRKYVPLHVECFDSIGEFIAYIWWPGCKWCETDQERSKVLKLRAVAKFAGFPIIAETLHTVLALIYYHKRKEHINKLPWADRCSSMSTRNPDKNIDNNELKKMVMDRVLNTLYESMLQLKDMTGQIKDLEQALILAHVANDRLYKSEEYSKFEKEVSADMQTCSAGPLEDAGLLYSKTTYPDKVQELCEQLKDPDEKCEASQDGLMRARVGGIVSLSKGHLTTWTSKQLWEVIKDVQGAELNFKAFFFDEGKAEACCKGMKDKCVLLHPSDSTMTFKSTTCMTGLQAAKELLYWPWGNNLAFWQAACAKAIKNKKICDMSSRSDLIRRVLLAAGAGEVGLASEENPFGLCPWENCPLENQVCQESGGSLPLKRCSCAKDHCFFAGKDAGFMKCVKAGSLEHGTVEIMTTKMRDYIRREELAFGELARDLRNAF